MKLSNDSKLLKVRNEIIENYFDTDPLTFEDIKELINNNNDIEDDLTPTIDWGATGFKDKTPEEIAYIEKFQKFYQNALKEYQFRTIQLLSDTTKDIINDDSLTSSEKRIKTEENLQNKVLDLILTMFIKCGNFGASTASETLKEQIEYLENQYITNITQLHEAQTEISELKTKNNELNAELERLKNKKFLGIFKIN